MILLRCARSTSASALLSCASSTNTCVTPSSFGSSASRRSSTPVVQKVTLVRRETTTSPRVAYPTTSPTASPRSSATRRATVTAATLRGCATMIEHAPPRPVSIQRSRTNCGAWVVLPEPVAPTSTVNAAPDSSTAATIEALARHAGRDALEKGSEAEVTEAAWEARREALRASASALDRSGVRRPPGGLFWYRRDGFRFSASASAVGASSARAASPSSASPSSAAPAAASPSRASSSAGAGGGSWVSMTVAIGRRLRVSASLGPGGACANALRGFFFILSFALALARSSSRFGARRTVTSFTSPDALVTPSVTSAPGSNALDAIPGCEARPSAADDDPGTSPSPPAGHRRSARRARRRTFSLRSRSLSARRASLARARSAASASGGASASSPTAPPPPTGRGARPRASEESRVLPSERPRSPASSRERR